MLLQALAPDLWHIQHPLSILGMRFSTRMTVVRLADHRLWLHSPIPISAELAKELNALGEVAYIVAPSKMHHLFVPSAQAAFPRAQLFGAPGLHKKRPDLSGMQELTSALPTGMGPDLAHICVQGIPIGNETAWFHAPTQTLILTDLCQWWQGELAWNAAFYAWLTGVRKQLVIPRSVRLMVKDKAAARASAEQILRWPFVRVIVAHNCIIEQNAKQAVVQAFAALQA